MQLLRVAHIGPCLVTDLLDRRRVQSTPFAVHGRIQPSQRHRARAPLLQRRVIEEGVGIGIENLVRHWRRHRGINRHRSDLARVDHREDFQ